jgi:peptidoglycan/LPS O-acetylase OafA/YrhL
LGLYSYSIYLTHSVVWRFSPVARAITLLRDQTFDSPWIERALFWGLSIATGYAVARLVERPFLRLRSRWLPMSAPDFRGTVSPAAPPGWRGSAKRIAL